MRRAQSALGARSGPWRTLLGRHNRRGREAALRRRGLRASRLRNAWRRSLHLFVTIDESRISSLLRQRLALVDFGMGLAAGGEGGDEETARRGRRRRPELYHPP